VPVTFHAPDGGASIQVQGGNLESHAGTCSSSCTLELFPGKYTIYLSTPRKSTWLAVDLREPSDVVVSSGDGVRRGVGLALMLTGGTLFLVGASLVYTDIREKIWAKTDASELPITRLIGSCLWRLPVASVLPRRSLGCRSICRGNPR